MYPFKENQFEISENEIEFRNVCEKLKNHTFPSPWAAFFKVTQTKNNKCEIQELNISLDFLKSLESSPKSDKNILVQNDSSSLNAVEKKFKILEEKLIPLKTCLSSIQNDDLENIDCIDSLNSLSLSMIPFFASFIHDALINENSVVVFLNSISNLKEPLSITISAALVNHIIYPKITQISSNSNRNLFMALQNFFKLYPKAIIDEMLVPSLKANCLEALVQETLIKMIKSNLPDEYVGYCIKSILNKAVASENTFSILLNLIEKKIQYEISLHDLMAFTIQKWSSINTKNMKFTKLMISILSLYGPELSEQQKEVYWGVVRSNETVMRRAAENVLKNAR